MKLPTHEMNVIKEHIQEKKSELLDEMQVEKEIIIIKFYLKEVNHIQVDEGDFNALRSVYLIYTTGGFRCTGRSGFERATDEEGQEALGRCAAGSSMGGAPTSSKAPPSPLVLC